MLHEQNGFDRRFPMSIQELAQESLIEFARLDFGRIAFPPIRFVGAVMEPNATELARVGEEEHAIALMQSEMVVLGRAISRRFDADLASHSEMNAEPIVARKFEEHSFAACVRVQKFCAD